MRMGAPLIEIDPTKEKPWYLKVGEQLLEANKIRQVQKINAERLAQGLPPLSEREMRSLTGAVEARVQLPQDLKNAIYLGGAAALFILFMAFSRKRRR